MQQDDISNSLFFFFKHSLAVVLHVFDQNMKFFVSMRLTATLIKLVSALVFFKSFTIFPLSGENFSL